MSPAVRGLAWRGRIKLPAASAHISTLHLADSNRNSPRITWECQMNPSAGRRGSEQPTNTAVRTHISPRGWHLQGLAACGSKIKKYGVPPTVGMEKHSSPEAPSMFPSNSLRRHQQSRWLCAFMSPKNALSSSCIVSAWPCECGTKEVCIHLAASLVDEANDATLTFIDPSPQVTTGPLLFLFLCCHSSQKRTR